MFVAIQFPLCFHQAWLHTHLYFCICRSNFIVIFKKTYLNCTSLLYSMIYSALFYLILYILMILLSAFYAFLVQTLTQNTPSESSPGVKVNGDPRSHKSPESNRTVGFKHNERNDLIQEPQCFPRVMKFVDSPGQQVPRYSYEMELLSRPPDCLVRVKQDLHARELGNTRQGVYAPLISLVAWEIRRSHRVPWN